jgi:hypothetical protein
MEGIMIRFAAFAVAMVVSGLCQAGEVAVRSTYNGPIIGYTVEEGGRVVAKDVNRRTLGWYDANRAATVDASGRVVCSGDCLTVLIFRANGNKQARENAGDPQMRELTEEDQRLANESAYAIAFGSGRLTNTWRNPASGNYGSWETMGAVIADPQRGQCRWLRMSVTTPAVNMTDVHEYALCANGQSWDWVAGHRAR